MVLEDDEGGIGKDNGVKVTCSQRRFYSFCIGPNPLRSSGSASGCRYESHPLRHDKIDKLAAITRVQRARSGRHRGRVIGDAADNRRLLVLLTTHRRPVRALPIISRPH